MPRVLNNPVFGFDVEVIAIAGWCSIFFGENYDQYWVFWALFGIACKPGSV